MPLEWRITDGSRAMQNPLQALGFASPLTKVMAKRRDICKERKRNIEIFKQRKSVCESCTKDS
jgi:hypothetical protein